MWSTKPLPKEELEKRIERCLTLTNLGYLATVRKDGSPVSSPLEYYNDEMTIYFTLKPRVRNIGRSNVMAEFRYQLRVAQWQVGPVSWACSCLAKPS